jgi:hypothetical protein
VDKRGFLSCATSARSIAQSVRHQDRGGDAQASRPPEIAELKGRDQLKSSSRCLGPLESQWHRVADANGRVLEEARATSSRKLVVASCSWWPQRRPLIDLNSSRNRALTSMTAYFTLIRTGTAGSVQTAQPAPTSRICRDAGRLLRPHRHWVLVLSGRAGRLPSSLCFDPK